MWKYKDVLMVPCILFPPLGTLLAAVCELVVARHTLDITMKYRYIRSNSLVNFHQIYTYVTFEKWYYCV